MEKVKAAFKSKAFISSVVALAVAVAASFGYQVSPEQKNAIDVVILTIVSAL